MEHLQFYKAQLCKQRQLGTGFSVRLNCPKISWDKELLPYPPFKKDISSQCHCAKLLYEAVCRHGKAPSRAYSYSCADKTCLLTQHWLSPLPTNPMQLTITYKELLEINKERYHSSFQTSPGHEKERHMVNVKWILKLHACIYAEV